MRRFLAVLALAAWAVSCAPAPPPAPPPVPRQPPASPPPVPSPSPTPTPEPRGASRTWFTIGLIWDVDTLTLAPVGTARLGGPASGTMDPHERLSLRVTKQGAVARVHGPNGTRQYTIWPADTLTMAAEGESLGRGLVRWDGKTWRGEMRVFVNPRKKLTLATRLPLETYLLGVIPAEIGPLAEDLLEAGRAQTIAARSFSLYYLGRRGVEGFDLFATVEDQVYGSVESERPLATRCVESTAGQVALFRGTPIRANYSSTCGGISTDVWEAWPEPPRPYLVSHRDRDGSTDYCSESRHYRWREEWSAAEFLSTLRNFAPTYGVRLPAGGLGELIDVQVQSRSRSGRVWWLVVLTTRGEVRIPSYSLRQVIRRPGNPAAILRSNLFKVDVRRNPSTRRALAVVASGAGSGHGVGLCQTGALGMAKKGRRGEQILEHYFPGASISRLY
ncbi:MAG TPA: SpoIID/LytB domain-containing protein [Candidatus Eisenbacteria bacterium]|nr:SpoIID/LytB domain-containing protein [Candidatus Eisenbacteria bacterium]